MNAFRKLCLAAVSGLALTAGAGAVTLAQAAPPSAADFARRPAISSVSVAPDGKHIAAITSPDGVSTLISVWNTEALDKPPVVIGANRRSTFGGIDFVKNDRIVAYIQQTYTAGNDKRHIARAFITDLQGSEWKTALGDEDQASINTQDVFDRLPLDPQNILVESRGDIYKVNVYRGTKERIERASDKYGSPQTDLKGDIRARQELDYDGKGVFIAQQLKNSATGAWEEHFRSYGKDRNVTEVVGFTTEPNVVLIRAANGRDRAGIYEYDVQARKIMEPAFEHKLFEAVNVIQSNDKADFGRILGFTYYGERPKQYWTDGQLDGLNKQLREALGVKTTPVQWTDIASGETARFNAGDGFDLSVAGYSDDRRTFVVEKSGPSQPPEYYLVVSGKPIQLLGRSAPQIEKSALGDTRLIQYRARDGLMVPGFLTTPPKSMGAGPFPALVLPHGGPWSRDGLDWDSTGWTQYFAARGYAVLQPQFRGSQGWGQKLWRAGDAEWGQKMQDDMDDGARWMIDQRVADPQRIALHGYSYGGYAAMAAAVRPGGLYQCAIAGAGVADLASIKRETFNDNRFIREYQRPTIEGLDPLAQVSKVSIPVLLYHGDRDTTVGINHSRDFNSALRRAGKPVKLIELKDMGHQGNLWTPENLETVLSSMDGYLKTDCGPGGL